jgi:EF hand
MRFIILCCALTASPLFAGIASGGTAKPPVESESARFRKQLIRLGKAVKQLEFAQMVAAIMSGSELNPGEAWFKPGQCRYDWNWLADRLDADRDGRITRKEFTGPPELFDRLDRDRNGVITRTDLDWSDASPWWREMRLAGQVIRKADKDGDRQLSRAEWEALFKELAGKKEYVNAEDLRALLFPPPPEPKPGPSSEMPSKWVLLTGLFKGELGSPSEGPNLGQVGPDFTLATQDGKKTITLSNYRGHKPVVLIFGSFT